MKTKNYTVERTCVEPAFCSPFQAMFLCGAKKSEVGLEMLFAEN